MKHNKDVFAAIIFIVISIIMFAFSFNIQEITGTLVGPKFMPRITGIIMFALAIALLIQGLRNDLNVGQEKIDVAEQNDRKKFVLYTILLLLAYFAFMEKIGFVISTAVYLPIHFILLSNKKERNIPVFIVFSLAIAISLFYLFRYAFYLMLPAGILG